MKMNHGSSDAAQRKPAAEPSRSSRSSPAGEWARRSDGGSPSTQPNPTTKSWASLQAGINQSPRQLSQRRTLGSLFCPAMQRQQAELDDGELVQARAASVERFVDEVDEGSAQDAIAQRAAAPAPVNQTGMPDQIKSGIESLSGIDLSDVRVHHNSEKPAQLNALAVAQGGSIHLGPGQERHLPHEAWHIVQQRQGRVQATTQMANLSLNDDERLEREADLMGSKAALPAVDSMKQFRRRIDSFGQSENSNRRLMKNSSEDSISARNAVHQRMRLKPNIDNYVNAKNIWGFAVEDAQNFKASVEKLEFSNDSTKQITNIQNNVAAKAKKAYTTCAGEAYEPREWKSVNLSNSQKPIKKRLITPGGAKGADLDRYTLLDRDTRGSPSEESEGGSNAVVAQSQIWEFAKEDEDQHKILIEKYREVKSGSAENIDTALTSLASAFNSVTWTENKGRAVIYVDNVDYFFFGLKGRMKFNREGFSYDINLKPKSPSENITKTLYVKVARKSKDNGAGDIDKLKIYVTRSAVVSEPEAASSAPLTKKRKLAES